MRASDMLRRGLGVLLGACCFVAAAVAYGAEPPTSNESTGALAPSATTSPPTSSSVPPTSPSASTATGRRAGPGITAPGTHLAVEPNAAGVLEVVERVRFSEPVSSLRLAPPSLRDVPGLAGVRAVVSQLQGEGDGRPLPVPSGSVTEPVTVEISPSREVALRYRLESSSVRSNPAPIGRVLLGLAPVLRPAAWPGEVLADVMGTGVRNIVCPRLPTARQVCGQRQGGGWAAGPVAGADALFVAQVDLPGPGGS